MEERGERLAIFDINHKKAPTLAEITLKLTDGVRTSNNTAVSSTVTGQSVASSGSDEPSRVPVV